MPNPVSWSELSCFENLIEDWEQKYIFGLKEPANFQMQRGTDIHHMIATGDRSCEAGRYAPDEIRAHDRILEEFSKKITHKLQFEKEVRVEIEGIPTKGFWDGWSEDDFVLVEIKTGTPWNAERVKNHGQLIFYSLQAIHAEGVWPIVKLFTAGTKNGKSEVIIHESSAEQLEEMKMRLRRFKAWCIEQKLWEKRLSSKDSIEI